MMEVASFIIRYIVLIFIVILLLTAVVTKGRKFIGDSAAFSAAG